MRYGHITNVCFDFTLQADERLLQDANDEQELTEMIRVYKSQENELLELKARLARFMTKGAPLLPLTSKPTDHRTSKTTNGAVPKKTSGASSKSKVEADDLAKGIAPKTIDEPREKKPKDNSEASSASASAAAWA